jgi:hypothetical protein
MSITLPKCYVSSNLPETGDPGVIVQNLPCVAIANTVVSGYAISMQINNATATYEPT